MIEPSFLVVICSHLAQTYGRYYLIFMRWCHPLLDEQLKAMSDMSPMGLLSILTNGLHLIRPIQAWMRKCFELQVRSELRQEIAFEFR